MHRRILILHEWAGQTYFHALDTLAKGPDGPGIEYREIMWIRQAGLGLLRRQWKLAWRGLSNLLFYFRSFFLSGRVIVIGIAPCDYDIVFWMHLMRRNTVVYHTSWTEWAGDKFARNSFPPFRSFVEKTWRRFLEHPRVRIVSILSESKSALLAHYRKDPSLIRVIPHTVDMAIFRWSGADGAAIAAPVAAAVDSTAGSAERPLKVAYVGRLATVKGIDVLVEIIRRADPARFEFTVIGDGPRIDIFRPLLPRANLRYLGHVADKRKIAAELDGQHVMVMPSVSEQFGIALIEGMACGLVGLASTGLVPKDLIRHGENGYVLPRTPEAFLETLETLQRDVALTERLRRASYAKAGEFAMPIIMDKWRDLLDGLD
jgi:glycosyltransferase involved in cell wall biosynthesis